MKTSFDKRNYFVTAFTGLSALLIGIGLGRFGYPPLIPALINHKWFTVAQADYLGAANLTGYIFGSVVATLLNRYIPSVTLIKSMLIITLITFLGCAYPLPFILYFVLRLIAGVTGGVLMVVTAPTLFKHAAKERKGVIGGLIFSGVGIGIALAGTIIPLLVTNGIRQTWFAFAIAAAILIIVTWKGWPNGSNEKHLPLVEKHSGKHKKIANRTVLLLLVSYACNAIGFVPHTVFWVDFISRGLHLGIDKGTQFWVLLGLAAAIGPLFTGYIADKVGFAKSIRISLAVKAIGVILPLVSTATWSLAVSGIFVGSLALGISSLAAGRTAELVLPAHQKKAWSYMTITYSVSHALTAYILTYIFSIYHSYYLLFVIGAVALIIGSVTDYWSSISVRQH
ncbi:hypothetical protein A9P82_07650 [Arachidicoccus ginsenosidimutans]|uniref:YbfB/YjiJ family MFS transporter n=1 Tax=Arachidicoccus sp. BS20 TaxID=1850526 RepID=UPI0007F0A52A|nr:YbfB/YjiJ family MFS transporter [Arachidicoccus sp. BS20]ANI89175.1 hypothetical protein A9P82_07650 [Arachidicoccus sp. BS20]